MKYLVRIIGLSCLMGMTQGYAASGEELFGLKGCNGCHGAKGLSPLPSFPSIGGQNKEYIFNQLHDFKSGARSNAASVMMKGAVADVNDQEMVLIADYLSSVK
jgi:cytochrome c553